MNKPKGLTVISEDNMTAIMSSLPIRKFQGVGPVTEQKLLRAGILTGQDLLDLGAENLQTRLGDFGLWLYTMVTGKDERQVTTHHERKSLGHEYTLEHDLTDRQTMLTHLKQITDKVCLDMNREELTGNTITVKIRYNNFSYASRRLTVKNPISKTEEVFPIVRNLLYALQIRRPIRLLGVTISAFCKPVADDAGEQLELPLFA
jgi:DNA polymerase-4